MDRQRKDWKKEKKQERKKDRKEEKDRKKEREKARKTHIGISSGMFDKFIWSSAVDFGADVEGLKKNYN
jgi:hypothetical protein